MNPFQFKFQLLLFLFASLAAFLSSLRFFSLPIYISVNSSSCACFPRLAIYVSRFFFSIAMSAILTISIVLRVCSDSRSSSLLFCISRAAICANYFLMKFSRISMPPPTYLSRFTRATRCWYIRLSIQTRSDSVW